MWLDKEEFFKSNARFSWTYWISIRIRNEKVTDRHGMLSWPVWRFKKKENQLQNTISLTEIFFFPSQIPVPTILWSSVNYFAFLRLQEWMEKKSHRHFFSLMFSCLIVFILFNRKSNIHFCDSAKNVHLYMQIKFDLKY